MTVRTFGRARRVSIVGDLVNIPVDLLPSKWVRACEFHPQTVIKRRLSKSERECD